jgi:hypothetical protein
MLGVEENTCARVPLWRGLAVFRLLELRILQVAWVRARVLEDWRVRRVPGFDPRSLKFDEKE